jgi:hypothetical protein
MSSLYFGFDVFFLSEARDPELDVVYASTATPIFRGAGGGEVPCLIHEDLASGRQTT